MKGREQSQGLTMESTGGVDLIPSAIIHLFSLQDIRNVDFSLKVILTEVKG